MHFALKTEQHDCTDNRRRHLTTKGEDRCPEGVSCSCLGSCVRREIARDV